MKSAVGILDEVYTVNGEIIPIARRIWNEENIVKAMELYAEQRTAQNSIAAVVNPQSVKRAINVTVAQEFVGRTGHGGAKGVVYRQIRRKQLEQILIDAFERVGLKVG